MNFNDAVLTVTDINSSNVTLSRLTNIHVAISSIEVYFDAVDTTGVTIKESTTLAIGDTEKLTATVMPDDATYKNVTWTSSNEKVATVDKNGKVTAVGGGEADITVTATNGTDFLYAFLQHSSCFQKNF